MEGSFLISPEVQINNDNFWFGEMKFRRTFFNLYKRIVSTFCILIYFRHFE